jgi:hypothetical protein
MTTVLRNLRHTGLVSEHPKLASYMARCESPPAFQRALAGNGRCSRRSHAWTPPELR